MNSQRDYEIDDDETTDSQWEHIAKLATKGDDEKLTDYLFAVGTVDPRAGRLFIIAIAEHKRTTAIVATAGEAAKQLGPLDRELQFLFRSVDGDCQTRLARVTEIEQQIAKLREQQAIAHNAQTWITGIVRRFPRLFNQKPCEVNGVLHWAPPVDAVSPALHDELRRLNLPGDTMDPWRYFPAIELPRKPRKKLPAFTTQATEA